MSAVRQGTQDASLVAAITAATPAGTPQKGAGQASIPHHTQHNWGHISPTAMHPGQQGSQRVLGLAAAHNHIALRYGAGSMLVCVLVWSFRFWMLFYSAHSHSQHARQLMASLPHPPGLDPTKPKMHTGGAVKPGSCWLRCWSSLRRHIAST